MTAPAIATRASDDMILIEHLPFETDGGIARRGRIGLIVLATDYTIEHEWRAIFGSVPGLALYQSRILSDNDVTPETLRAMEPRIAAAADLILPGSELDVVAYGCTSASMAIGEEKVFGHIRSVRPNALCTTPITAAFAAFRALGARRIGVLTPYRAEVNLIVADYIRARGFRRAGVRVVQRRRRHDGGAHLAGLDQGRRRGDHRQGRRRCGVRVVHVGQARGSGGGHRGRDRLADHLVEPRHGLACHAARRRGGRAAAVAQLSRKLRAIWSLSGCSR
jgi:hypothetical protein